MKRFFFLLLIFPVAISLHAGMRDTVDKELPIELQTESGKIYGTLTVPTGKGKVPVALLIAGSGPTDRNGNSPMIRNEGLRKLAYGLAASRIASLRYDKRGVGESAAAMKGEAELRFDDYVNDARDWIALLKKDSRFSSVIVIGHSEGSLIGMLAAAGMADGFVSLAGAGRPADQVIRQQLEAQPQKVRELSFPILDSLAAGKTVTQVNPLLYGLFRPSVQPYMISWFRYNPQEAIRKLAMPVLIIGGTNDIQVPVEEAKLLVAAKREAQLELFTDMNHVLRTVKGDRAANFASYSEYDLPLAAGLLPSLSKFIKAIHKK